MIKNIHYFCEYQNHYMGNLGFVRMQTDYNLQVAIQDKTLAERIAKVKQMAAMNLQKVNGCNWSQITTSPTD